MSEIVTCSEYDSKVEVEQYPMDFSKYFLSTDFSDVTIICGTEKFPAHRIILAGSNNMKSLLYQQKF